MDREQLDNWCEKGVLGLVLAIVTFSVLAFGAAGPPGFLVVQWMAVALLGIWTLRFLINPKHRLLWTPVCWPVLAFILYAIARYWTADVEYLARQELVRVVVYSVIFFAVLNNLHKQEPSQILGLTLIFLAMALSFYAVLQFLKDWDEVWGLFDSFEKPRGNRKRGSGTFVNPNHLAGFLEMVLPLALAFTLTGRFSHLMKIVLAYASVAIFVGLTVTFSRGGWIASAASLAALFYWTLRQREYWKRTVIALGVFAVLFAVTLTKARMSVNRIERFEEARQFDDIRFRLWEPAKVMWKDHLWLGVGPNHFDARFGEYRPFDYDLQSRPDRAHNDYLNTLADWGLVGTLLVTACWGTFFWQVFTGWRFVQRSQNDLGAKRSNRAAFVLGGTLGLLAILVHSYWDFNMHIPANAILTVTILALVSSYYRFASERYWHTVRLPLRIVVYPVLAAALFWLGTQSWRRTRECVAMVRLQTVNRAIATESAKADPERLAALGKQQIAALEQVVVAEPKNFEAAIELGEALRIQSFVGLPGCESLAEKALVWFLRAMELNAYEARSRIGYGMCLDWLGRTEEAGRYFEEARRLDGNQFTIAARVGWHHFQIQDYAGAKQWFEQSIRLAPNTEVNSNAYIYRDLTNQKLAESTNSPFLKR
jgi:O-antigen ligase/Flp pilus assembly protein TadD